MGSDQNKKVLIISYFFYPNTTIVSSLRPWSWFNSFDQHGISPTVITRHWQDKPAKNVNYLLEEDLSPAVCKEVEGKKIYYLPHKKSTLMKLAEWLEKYTVLRPVFLIYKLFLAAIGIYTNEADIDYSFRHFVLDLLKKEKFDAVITSAMPISAAKLAYYINKEHDIPVFVDFRDYWNNNLLSREYKFPLRARMYFYIEEIYIRKWLSKVKGILSVSQPILDKIEAFSKAKKILVFNGFEESLYDGLEPRPGSNFRISILGALYAGQNIDFMIEGFKRFIKDKQDVEICFVGLKYFEELANHISKELGSEKVFISERIERKEALKYMIGSEVLYYIGWKGFSGIYSGKIFEYLGAKRNILLAPSDKDVIEDLLVETNAGVVADSVDEMVVVLNKWYAQWKATGKLEYGGKPDSIRKYTREYQAEQFAEVLNGMI